MEKSLVYEKIGGWISTLLLGQTKEIIVRTDERVLGLMDSMKEVKKTLDDFRVEITHSSACIEALQIHTRYGIAKSPMVPNQKGKDLLERSKFNQQYPHLQSKIFETMDSMNLRTLYDYEVGAIKALGLLQNDPLMDPIKEYLVSNPNDSLETVFKVASWILRDDYVHHRQLQK